MPVKPWDFKFYNELFDLRMILEKEAVKRLCEMDHETSEELQALKRIWLVPVEEYKQESKQLIFVLPEYRRQGIATELCQLLFAYAQQQNIQHLYLHTHPFLPAAEKFWRLQSFSTVSRDQLGMYDTIHMLKRLCL